MPNDLPQINCEADLARYLQNDGFVKVWAQYFPDLTLIAFEQPVFGCISREKIGVVDIFCQKGQKGQKYFIEIKYDKCLSSGDFWNSLKVLGYTESQNMYNFNTDIKPAIMINKELLRYDFRAILGKLNIGYIAFNLDTDSRLLGFEVCL